MTSRHFNRHLFIERKQQEGETVDEFCSVLKTLAKNCDLAIKKILDNVHVSSRPQRPEFKGETDGKRSKFGENVDSSWNRRDK